MDMNKEKVQQIIGDNSRFISPYAEPEGYYIYKGKENIVCLEEITLYFERLEYAVSHAEELIRQAFGDGTYFYDYLFKDFDYEKKLSLYPENAHWYEEMNKIKTPEQMFQGLRFESFVLDKTNIGAYLSNPDFMPGNFIEAIWDENWNLLYSWIC